MRNRSRTSPEYTLTLQPSHQPGEGNRGRQDPNKRDATPDRLAVVGKRSGDVVEQRPALFGGKKNDNQGQSLTPRHLVFNPPPNAMSKRSMKAPTIRANKGACVSYCCCIHCLEPKWPREAPNSSCPGAPLATLPKVQLLSQSKAGSPNCTRKTTEYS